jgi:predicted permease
MFQDLRFGLRMLRKKPGFSVIVVLTLALGIGANVALFSVVNGVLLDPLPYPQPDQLVTLHQSKPNFAQGAIPYPNFQDWRKQNQTFSAMAISRGASFTLLGVGEAEQVNGRWVSAEIFSVLGVEPAIGRNFAKEEDERGAAPVVLISHNLWQSKFNSSRDVLSQSLTLDDKSYSIIGVLPKSFALYRGDVYVPIGQWSNTALQSRNAALGLHGIGRLKPGVTVAQAQSDMDGVMRRLAETYPDSNRGNGATLIPLKQRLVGDVGTILWTLFGAVGFVLLIACVNVSNLMLASSTGRTREFAIRAAMGAGRWRLLRQSLVESTLLAVLGGALGFLLAAWGTKAALAALPTALPRAQEVGLDIRVLLFACAVSLLTGVVSGLTPAIKASQRQLSETLKEVGRGHSGARHRAQGVLVAVEIALAMVLLIGAGLMLRTLSALWNVDPGFRADNVLTFELGLPPSMRSASPESAAANLTELSELLNALPGVTAASLSDGAVPMQGEDDLFFWRDGVPKPASTSEMQMALVYRVEPGYLPAMRIPLRQGRFFTNQDDTHSPSVAVIDEAFARKHFPNEDPIGKRINIGDDADPRQIVGIVSHIKQWSINADDTESLQAQLYLPFRQVAGNPPRVGVVLRSDGVDGKVGAAFFDSVRRAVQSQHSQNVVFGSQTMNEVIADSLSRQRFSMIVLNGFALVALLLASLGLYGVISYLVSQRTHELGIRLALGAQRRDLLFLVLGHGARMALGGVALGLVAALALTRLLSTFLFGVSPTDPMTFLVIAVMLTGVALLACWLPATRATRVDPLLALRHD